MPRWAKWVLIGLAIIVGLPVLAIGVILLVLNTGIGQRMLANQIGGMTGGQVIVTGLHGGLPGSPRVGRIELRDAQGVWLVADDVALDWSPLALLSDDANVQRLDARRVAMERLPVSATQANTPSQPGGTFQLPVRVDADSVHVDRIELAKPLAGSAAAFSLDGSAHLVSLQQGNADITVRNANGPGLYEVKSRIDPNTVWAVVTASEPAHGMLASLAQLPDLGVLAINFTMDGPRTAVATKLGVTAGPLTADAHGTINLQDEAADLTVSAHAPKMAPAPGITFDAVALDARVQGPFAAPDATGTLRVDALEADGAAVGHLAADVSGNRGHIGLKATADGVRIPGPRPNLLEASPVTLTADANLDDPARPVTFDLTHPLLHAQGTARTAGTMSVKAHIEVPDLSPLAAIGGVDLQGQTALDVDAALRAAGTDVSLAGTLGLTGGMAPAPALIGPDARIELTASMHGNEIVVSNLRVVGKTIQVAASGALAAQKVDAAADVTVSDLQAVQPTLQGDAHLHAHVTGATDDLAVQAELSGDIGTTGVPKGKLTAKLDAHGLPPAPTGRIEASGQLDGAPLELAVDVTRAADGAVAMTIDHANWKSAHAEGDLSLANGAALPTGHVALRVTRLEDLRRISGQNLTGSINGTVDLTDSGGQPVARAQLRADGAGLPGTVTADRLTLDARIINPTGDMIFNGTLAADGLEASGIAGDFRVQAQGPRQALGLNINATAQDVAGGPAQAASRATLDLPAKSLAIASLSATARGETLHLLAPAKVSFGNGVSVDRLRIGLRQAVLQVAGRLSPTLDVTASLRNVTADLASIADPSLQADGTLMADARLTGTPAQPQGTVSVTASGLHLRTGPASGLPPMQVSAQARLAQKSAEVDARLTAGANQFAVTGTAPLGLGGGMDLHATGHADLSVLDPLLAPSGRRARGNLMLDATVTGTPAAPRANGSARLAKGEIQDFAQGIRIADIQALIEAAGDRVQIAHLTGRAGPGTISASGSVGLAAPQPVDLHVTMAKARPLSSDRLTAQLDADLLLRGELQGRLDASGKITVLRAEIRVPDRLPSSIAVLDVRVPGEKPPPPPSPGPNIGLDIAVHSPGQMFVRGRGIDAELRGDLHLGGTAAAPRPDGGFVMRRGSISVAGTSLTFTTGKVTFDGSGKLDPTLDFVATSTSANVTATLEVTGYGSAPKITLSSVPALPQDEVLAHLLFGQPASSLSPFQLGEIALALVQLTGAPGSGLDPLGAARKALGLDTLSLGGGSGTSAGGATLQAGRYVAPGVYVGAKQGTSGAASQAQVQIDLYKGLKLETQVGTGGASATGAAAGTSSNGTGIGLTYQFEY